MKNKSKKGFFLIEGLLILVAVAAIIGVSAFVYINKSNDINSNSILKSESTPKPNGTTNNIDELIGQDFTDEDLITSEYDSSNLSIVDIIDEAQNSLGDTYNESSF